MVAACDVSPAPSSVRSAELPVVSPPQGVRVPAPLAAAHCEIDVEGHGIVDLEDDYLPRVITCENGGANLEALKAQAIAARSVAYYAIETSGGICDSQGCQVYSCAADPGPLAYQAVEETSGLYLMYSGTLTYGFYVAGDNDTAPPACVGVSGSTEHWVTYNEGQSGVSVEQTELGFVHDPADAGYGQNRGCMSQWGARCLENNNGYDYLDILRFYYGADVELVQAVGECVIPSESDGGSTGLPPNDDGGASTTDGDGGTTAASDDGEPPPTPGDEGSAGDGPPPGGTSDDEPFDAAEDTLADGPALPTTFGEDTGGGGCACRASTHERPGGARWALMLLGLAAIVRRRR